MTTFLFHVYAAGEFFADPAGFPCDDVRAARRHAARLAETIVTMAPQSYEWARWSVLVAEANGPVALALPFPPRPEPRRPAPTQAAVTRRRFPKVLAPGEGGPWGPPANEVTAPRARHVADETISFGRHEDTIRRGSGRAARQTWRARRGSAGALAPAALVRRLAGLFRSVARR